MLRQPCYLTRSERLIKIHTFSRFARRLQLMVARASRLMPHAPLTRSHCKIHFAACIACTLLVCASLPAQDPSTPQDAVPIESAANEAVTDVIRNFLGRGQLADGSRPQTPDQSIASFRLPADLRIETVSAEPNIAQPLFLSFDERGRIWVVEYRQYPVPAGLKVTHYDQYLRAVFDKVPPPPPHHFRGADRITLLSDSEGDGRYEQQKTLLGDLNIATSAVADAEGWWVLNPPYLLYYPDADHDDVPDRDPEVHLSGFGIEDTHAVANSLRWGPDAWLYGANGSTTTGRVRDRSGNVTDFEGQCIWRYHPRRKQFEIYAEGGGNTFSVEIDSVGRVFSGTNNGKTRGMYYPQGSYGEKNWGKHGPLTNPFAYGYFRHMRSSGDADRFAQAFAIYEADHLPQRYHGTIIAANALHNRVWVSRLSRDGSSFQTDDLSPLVETDERWFRPVDVKVGPDGAIYFADWYDSRLTHVDPRDDWHKSSGRIYRLASQEKGLGRETDDRFKDFLPSRTRFDLFQLTTDQLIRLLDHPNTFFRQASARVLGWRADPDAAGPLGEIARSPTDPRCLEALWALSAMDSLNEDLAVDLCRHPNPHVRRWTSRLLGDRRQVSPRESEALVRMAMAESDIDVRSQLSATAKRLPTNVGLAILEPLLRRAEDAEDTHQPLMLWWAIEAHGESRLDDVISMLSRAETIRAPVGRRSILPRLMRRSIESPQFKDWQACRQVLRLALDDELETILMDAMDEAVAGRSIANLPEDLASKLKQHHVRRDGSDLMVRLRAGEEEAIAEAIARIKQSESTTAMKVQWIGALGDGKHSAAVDVMLNSLRDVGQPAMQRVALTALQRFDNDSIGRAICQQLHSSLADQHGVRHTALRVLSSRANWANDLIHEVESWRLKSQDIPTDVLQQMNLHDDPALRARIAKIWGSVRSGSNDSGPQIERVKTVLRATSGDPTRGEPIYTAKCGNCHRMFGRGGDVGPDLTGYERTNLDFMIPAVVDPSLAIREEYTAFVILTTDARVLTGLLVSRDAQKVVIKGQDNQVSEVVTDEIESLQALATSLMPDNLLADLTDQQIADLFAYLTLRAPSVSEAAE